MDKDERAEVDAKEDDGGSCGTIHPLADKTKGFYKIKYSELLLDRDALQRVICHQAHNDDVEQHGQANVARDVENILIRMSVCFEKSGKSLPPNMHLLLTGHIVVSFDTSNSFAEARLANTIMNSRPARMALF